MDHAAGSTSAVLAGLLLGAVLAAQEPADVKNLDRRRLEQRLSDLGGPGSRIHAAMRELVEMGPPVVPALIEALRAADAEGDSRRAVCLVRVLSRMREGAVAAVPALLELLPNEQRQLEDTVLAALGEIGPYSRAHGEQIRAVAVAILGAPVGADVLSTVLAKSSPTRPDAVRTYARTLLDPRGSPDELAAGLSDKNPYVREYAAELLGERPVGSEAVTLALLRAIEQPHPKEVECGGARFGIDLDRRIRHLSARALARLAPEDPRSVPAHVVVLGLARPEERRASVMALGRMGAAAAAAVPALLEVLQSDLVSVRHEVITALGMIGPAAKSAIPALEKLAELDDAQTRERAKAALRQIRGQ